MNPKDDVRTLGDGMDNTLLNLPETTSKALNNLKLNLRPTSNILKSLKPQIPHESQVHYLVPKYIPVEHKQKNLLLKKPREPKFVPYEPYKAAVEPIMPIKRSKNIAVVHTKPTKNDVEIQELVTQLSEFRTTEMNKAKLTAIENKEGLISKKQWQKEKQSYETDIKNLRETNAHLENQLKFQAQVNSELKTLLVAAVGEDLESRVQHLTEDKLQLARALLNSANHLTSHQEQTEWLSGQCEVWRSKFLASSLMVEELARWKSALSKRIDDLQEVSKALLEERSKLHKQSLKTAACLTNILSKISSDKQTIPELKNNNNLSLSFTLFEVSQRVTQYLKLELDSIADISKAQNNYTPAEKLCLKLLQNPVSITNKPDVLCNAVLGAATSLSGQQMFLQHPSVHATCCAHCKGEIQHI